MNIAVVNIKDIIKYFLRIGIIIILIYICMQFVKGIKNTKKDIIKENLGKEVNRISKNSFLQVLDLSVPMFSYNNNEESKIKIASNKEILAMGAGIFDKSIFENTDLVTDENELSLDDGEEIANHIEEIPKDAKTEVVEKNNIKPNYTGVYNGVEIDNQSDYNITKKMLSGDVKITNKKDVLIYHTHTCESYTPSKGYKYKSSGNFRTTDLNYSVARVGTELSKYLKKKGFNVTHNTTYHDYPSYSGSYDRSLETVQELLEGEDTQFVLDIHRDAVGSSSSYAPRIKIGDKYAAQLMFVIGTDGGGLEHPNWKENLRLAIKIQQKANEMYPGLFRPIIVRNSRYNQHVTNGASIIEVGATGNTMDQCILSMQCLANVFEEVCK